MLSSRFLFLGTTLFRPHNPIFPLSPIHSLSTPIRFRRFSSTSADTVTAGGETELSLSLSSHPWPEWVTFVDRLRTKGYFTEPPDENEGPENVYRDMNVVKDACLSFARDRYDVFKSLSLEDIQTVVGRGCPNLLRKAVNSSKRLRGHVRLDEGDVCSACDLRGSCDRSYVILKGSEAAARTVDVVRILLFYALDPLVLSGGEKSSGRELVDASARKLLTELVELSEKSPDPALSKPAVKASSSQKERSRKTDESSQSVQMKNGDWVCPKCEFVNYARNEKCRECNEVRESSYVQPVMQNGDWLCPECDFMNFARNVQCLKCKSQGPKRLSNDDTEMKKGDWNCPKCDFMNFARNIRCLKCKAEGPERISPDDIEMKKGDWNCPGCGFINFASNRKCLRCQDPRPKRQLNPGEWECTSCYFVNFRRNKVCKKCNTKPLGEVTLEYEAHTWRRPS